MYRIRLRAMVARVQNGPSAANAAFEGEQAAERMVTGTLDDFIEEPVAPCISVRPDATSRKEGIYAELKRDINRVWSYGGVHELQTQSDGSTKPVLKFKPLVFWAHQEVMDLLPCHFLLARIYFALLMAEATTERSFSDSGGLANSVCIYHAICRILNWFLLHIGLTASDKRKGLDPKHISNATMANHNEKHFPVSASESKASYYS